MKKAEAKLKNLLDYTKPKRIHELRVEVEKARSDELAKKAEWQTLHSKSKRLEESIKPKSGQKESVTRSNSKPPGFQHRFVALITALRRSTSARDANLGCPGSALRFRLPTSRG